MEGAGRKPGREDAGSALAMYPGAVRDMSLEGKEGAGLELWSCPNPAREGCCLGRGQSSKVELE